MVKIRPSRIVNGALGLVTAGVMLATPLAAFAQSAPTNPQTLVPGPDAAGAGWTLQLTAGDTNSWVSIYGPTDASDKVSNISAGVKIFPSADAVAKDFADNTNSMKKAGYTVTDVQGIGDKAVKVSGSVGNKKTAESFYLFAIGTTMGGVAAQTTPAKFNDVDQVAVNVANAELNLVRSGGQGATPAQATPGGLAKALAVPINAVGDGWGSQNEKLDPNGKSYTVDFQPTDGTKQLASLGVWVLDTPDQVDALINQLADPLRQQGWAITPQDTYGDHTGIKGTLGSADAAGTLYLMGVGNKVALVLSVAPPTNAQDASDMADSLASVQEGRLY